jgi:flagellar biogenesis protein FliO
VLVAALVLCAPPRGARAQAGGGGEVEAGVTRVDRPRVERSAIEKQPLNRTNAAGAAAAPTTQKAGARAAAPAAKAPVLDAGRVALALAAVVALIFLLRWVAKRFFGVTGTSRSTRAVQVLSRSPLSPRQQLVLLRVGRRLLIVADGGGQMNTLSEITDPDEVAALVGQLQDDHGDRGTKSFGTMFGRMRGSYEEQHQPHADGGDHAATDAEPADLRRGAEEEQDPAVASARRELSGLMDRVRSLSSQFKGS